MSKETNMALFNTFGFKGLELRDYFAAKAMQALLAKTGWSDFKDITRGAYVIADDMLKEREIER
mgnify:CR=1 FL=1